jgi:hypothetical protein
MDQPYGIEVGHVELSVGFSKVIPVLARLSILILSKTYPLRGILSQVTRLMKALNEGSGFKFS